MQVIALMILLTRPAAADTLATALVAEAANPRDHAAILHVLGRRARRADVGVAEHARDYCAAWRKDTPRARRMRRIAVDADYRRRHPLYAQWRRARARVVRWAWGAVRDPCRGRAWRWGGSMDPPRGRMREIDCGSTSNRFYDLGG